MEIEIRTSTWTGTRIRSQPRTKTVPRFWLVDSDAGANNANQQEIDIRIWTRTKTKTRTRYCSEILSWGPLCGSA